VSYQRKVGDNFIPEILVTINSKPTRILSREQGLVLLLRLVAVIIVIRTKLLGCSSQILRRINEKFTLNSWIFGQGGMKLRAQRPVLLLEMQKEIYLVS
jgi:hypothetical protein